MNQSQRKFFIKRIEELAAEKLRELENSRAKECAALVSIRDRACAYMKKYPEKASKDLYAIAKEQLEDSKSHYPEVKLYGEDDTPLFFQRIRKEFSQEQIAIYETYEKKFDKVRAEKKKVINRAYFEELPAEFLRLLEKFEAFKV